MKVQTYKCAKCSEPFASRKDPKAKLMKDRPQCSVCGTRIK